MTEEPVEIPITGELDLHTFLPDEVHLAVKDYIEGCLERSISAVRFVHGKGTGTLRSTVRAVLAKHPRVRGFGDASPREGGWGVTWATLE